MSRRYGWLMPLVAALVSAQACSSCRRSLSVPDPVYREAVSAFYTGLAALQTSQEVLARQKFERVTAIVPDEPAAWANLGLLMVRQQEVDGALQKLGKAADLAPTSGAIQRMLGLAESRRGNLPEAIKHWSRAIELDPGDIKSAFALAQETARQGGAQNEAAAMTELQRLLERSDNLAARLELARLAAKRGDAAVFRQVIAPLASVSAGWPAEAQAQLASLQAAAGGDPRAAATRVVFLKNLLLPVLSYRRALAAVTTPNDAVGEPLAGFLALPNPSAQPAAADQALAFAVQPLSGQSPTAASWVGPWSAGGDGAPVAAVAGSDGLSIDGHRVEIKTDGKSAAPLLRDATPAGVVAADLNYDFKTDLVFATPHGIVVLRQNDDGTFVDATKEAQLPAALTSGAAYGVWAVDVDLDGDLDVVVAPSSGAPVVLRNNSDGTFAPQTPFSGVTGLRGFAWADFDGDGVPDAALLDHTGAVHVLLNLRGSTFHDQTLPSVVDHAIAVTAADVSGGSTLDLVVLTASGSLLRVGRGAAGAQWESTTLAKLDRLPGDATPGSIRLMPADLDNNAATDLIVAGAATTRVLLGGPVGTLTLLPATLPLGVDGVADLDGDGRLDLLGLDVSRQPARAVSHGSKAYHWQVLRPRAANTHGDQRINSFGIGGEVEVRTVLQVQKQTITSPVVHVGLGEVTRADVIRIVWPNGMLQSEFDKPADATVAASQRLKGSCPWLFAWDGREMAFVTDLIWRSPLGLRINAQATADVLMTDDRVKVPGSRLVPRDGAYDLRITAELWETHFFDLVSLQVVDHPAGTEVFVDERFAVPPPSLDPIVTGPVRPFRAAHDDRGVDVSAIVNDRDDEHLDTAGRGAYQGITRDHYVELEMPDEAPREGPLWLVAQGWIHPTDSSVNVAIGQGSHVPPHGLSLSVLDTTGQFRVVQPNLGFPAGKDKTVLVDLSKVFVPGAPRRIRLSTNLEIYWDRIGWAVGQSGISIEPRTLPLLSAMLRDRGFSVIGQRSPSSPERPRYAISGTAARWLDLEGFYTRFGDVRELLTRVDDRYVIMNAGDELALQFPAAAPPAPGFVRDFIVVSDGWVKDGDYNTTFSRTVLPLPTHATGRYATPPGRLQDDPVYRAHEQDFATYHTRYVTAASAREALQAPSGAPR